VLERIGEAFGREARDEMQRRTGKQAAHAARREAEDVRDRQRHVDAIVGAEPAEGCAGDRGEQQVAVGE
jgi:hypothetical protein